MHIVLGISIVGLDCFVLVFSVVGYYAVYYGWSAGLCVDEWLTVYVTTTFWSFKFYADVQNSFDSIEYQRVLFSSEKKEYVQISDNFVDHLLLLSWLHCIQSFFFGS